MMYFYFFYFILFACSSFLPLLVSSKVIIKNLIEGPVGCPLEGHVACNSHNPGLKCLCYISEYASYTNIYPLCNDFDFAFARYFVMEFKVNLTTWMQDKYNWNDFDMEMALLISDAVSVPAKNVVFLRKKCKGEDLMIQFAILKSQTSLKVMGTNFKHHEKVFEQIRVAVHSFHNYMVANGVKYGISEVKETTNVVPLNRMMGPGMGNFCERNELSTPVICNAHRTDRQCICKATKEQAYYGSSVIDCDRLTTMETSFRTSFYKFGSIAFLETIKTPNPAVFDALFTAELETLMDIPEGSIMIVRKYCKNHKLHVQFIEFENPKIHPPFTESDFSYSSFKTLPISKFRNKMDIGTIAESESASAMLLPPIIKDSPEDVPFDATFFVKLFHILFFGVTYRYYVACFLPIIIISCIIYSIKIRLDKEEAEFEKVFPRPQKSYNRRKFIEKEFRMPSEK